MKSVKQVVAVLLWCAVSVGCVADETKQVIPDSNENKKILNLDRFVDQSLCREIGAYLEESIYPLNKRGEINPLSDWKEYEVKYKIDGKIETGFEIFAPANMPIKDKKILARQKSLISGRPYHIIYFLNKEDFIEYPAVIGSSSLYGANQINPIGGSYNLRNSKKFNEPFPRLPIFFRLF